MGQPRERFQRGLDQPVAFFTVHVRQQRKSTAIPEALRRFGRVVVQENELWKFNIVNK